MAASDAEKLNSAFADINDIRIRRCLFLTHGLFFFLMPLKTVAGTAPSGHANEVFTIDLTRFTNSDATR